MAPKVEPYIRNTFPPGSAHREPFIDWACVITWFAVTAMIAVEFIALWMLAIRAFHGVHNFINHLTR